jgi:hypothetical protein
MTSETVTEISAQSIVDELNAFSGRNRISYEEAASIAKITPVAAESFHNSPYLPVGMDYLNVVRKRLEEWETKNIYPVNISPIMEVEPLPQPTVSAPENFSCESCSKVFENIRQLSGHKRHCSKTEEEHRQIVLKSAATRQKRNTIEFDGNPPSVTIKLKNQDDIVKYIDFDSNSKHIFTRDEDGSVTIYRA